jgi:hypothetical protein
VESRVGQRPLRTKPPRKILPAWLLLSSLATFALLGNATPAMSQELEPRFYSASPINTTFAIVNVSNSTGYVNIDASLPLSNVRASINTGNLSFSHTFGLAGRMASWAVTAPYLGAHVSGAVFGQAEEVSRYGFPNMQARLALNVLGRALTPREFARQKPRTTLGVSLTIVAPTGTYDRTHLINIGSNRWSFKPEIGMEQPMGKWFADVSAGLWVYGDNTDFFRGQVLQQAPLSIFQWHTGYNFRPGQWLAADADYYSGGATSVSGATPIDSLADSRYGLTFSQPMGPGTSVKLAWSHWLNGRVGQDFSTIGVTFQYLWFGKL